MPSTTITPSIDQGAKLTFESNFIKLRQQQVSQLGGSPCVAYVPSMGKAHNVGRMGRIELTEVNTRNPKKNYVDYNIDNRQFSKTRYTATIQIDALKDINELIADPTSDLLASLVYGSKRTEDTAIVAGAVGPVLVGAPDAALTSVSAENDGVLEIDATGGVDYDAVQMLTQNFFNNSHTYDSLRGVTMCLAGKEHRDLMGITQFVNNDFIAGKPVDAGVMRNAGLYNISVFPGSASGSFTVARPIISEVGAYRYCPVIAPGAMLVSYELKTLEVVRANDRVNSWDITIELWIGTMRREGVDVQILKTTI